MDRQASQAVAVLSTLLCCASLLTSVSLAIILTHWHDALNACEHANCGCLLYARVSLSSYPISGSDASLCWFSGLAPLPGLAAALALAAWYGYCGFIRPPPGAIRTTQVVRAADGSSVRFLVDDAIVLPAAARSNAREDSAYLAAKAGRREAKTMAFIALQCVVCVLFALLAVAHVAMLTDGFLTACHEYRHAVLKTLRADGSLALLVNERLSCSVIFDFLDYMKPDVRVARQGDHWFPGQRGLTTVNTSAALVVSLVAAYSCLALWLALAFKFGRTAQRMAQSSGDVSSGQGQGRSQGQGQGRGQGRHPRGQQPMHCTDL